MDNEFCSYEPTNLPDNKDEIAEDISQIKEDISYLRDLFVRRLKDDKQKSSLIQNLLDASEYTFVEPFIHDIILLLDRLEKTEDEFTKSVKDELYDIFNRRGLIKIEVTKDFNPAYHKAIKVTENQNIDKPRISGVVRNGYIYSGKVVRPAEVIVERPC